VTGSNTLSACAACAASNTVAYAQVCESLLRLATPVSWQILTSSLTESQAVLSELSASGQSVNKLPVAPASTVCAIDSGVFAATSASLTRARGSSRTAILQLGMPR
jgi:hypothetical protein